MGSLIGFFILTAVIPSVIILLYMCGGFAERSGWQRLAEHYRAPKGVRGTRCFFQSATLNGFGFHGILVLGSVAEGLYMKPIWLLRAFHPPLLVPWDEVAAEAFGSTRYAKVRLRFASVPDVPLEWSEATHRRVTTLEPPHLP